MYKTACELLSRTGLLSLLRQRNRGRTAILMYHGLREDNAAVALANSLHKNVPRGCFREQISWLKKHCLPVSLSEAVSSLSEPCRGGRQKVAITFDDGYLSTYLHAWPICRELGVPFTVFVATDLISKGEPVWTDRVEHAVAFTRQPMLDVEIEKQSYHFDLGTKMARNKADRALRAVLKRIPGTRMPAYIEKLEQTLQMEPPRGHPLFGLCSWVQLKEMAKSGFVTIGAHTVKHRIMTQLSEEEMMLEVTKSRKAVEECVGACHHFAYPNGKKGDFSAATERCIRQAGFLSASTAVEGFNRSGDNPFTLRRLGIYGQYGHKEFLGVVSGFHLMLKRLLGKPL